MMRGRKTPTLIFLVFAIGYILISQPARAANPISLIGSWRFELDPTDSGLRQQWFNRDLRDRIQLPGILQAQGFGNEISIETP
jgi:hypothetical protein